MRSCLLIVVLLICSHYSFSQTAHLTGRVIDSATQVPLKGVTITLQPGNKIGITDETGRFVYQSIPASAKTISISAIGYHKETLSLSDFSNGQVVVISQQPTQLSDVVITANAANPYKVISETDIKMRGVTNSQELLRIVPGLFIGQHQGGGKAEQIFLRGFDNDHGTDINMSVDGMPINMVSQAHGQGYADSHFIIPETIESTNYQKGMYAASEYRYSDSYFDNPQHFKRFNFFTKYHGRLNANNWLTVSASTLYSTWKASGQIPESAVNDGVLGFYGALDPNEGGVTSRTNVNAQLLTTLSNNDIVKNQFYYSRYKFDLHTNFTFYLVDTVNGDEIRQREARNLYGYNGSYHHESYIGNTKLTTDAGINSRLDITKGSELSHTANNFTVIDPIKLGDITELGARAYLGETFQFSSKFSMNAGLRFDQFYHRYNNKLATDSTLNGIGVYTADNNIVSPKLNFYYHVNDKTQFYLLTGKGFHSNDTRVVVAQGGLQTLPAAYGADIGTVFKPTKNLLINAALWCSYLQKEYVYAGDGGSVEFSGRTRRIGVDMSGRYQPLKSLYFDADINYAH
jgi:hypothetical protein